VAVTARAAAANGAPIAGVRADASLGVATYVDELARALALLGVDYRPAARPLPDRAAHFHLVNSSRAPLWRAPLRAEPFALTIHDVLPRARALRPAYRIALPLLARRAAVTVVHSRFAAGLLARAGVVPRRLEVVPHATPTFEPVERSAARRALGWPADRPVLVLPGVLKPAKLVREALAAAAPLSRAGRLALVLVGPARLPRLEAQARAAGASVLAAPSTQEYRRAVAASDGVLVLRARSVGETNGPLLDALAAGRPVLATATGSIPEVADGAARLCEATVEGIRRGLEAMCDPDERARLAAQASVRAAAYRPDAVAQAHAALFAEVLDA